MVRKALNLLYGYLFKFKTLIGNINPNQEVQQTSLDFNWQLTLIKPNDQ